MATAPKINSKEIGVSGTLSYQGLIYGEDYNRKLTGHNGIRNYEIVRRSDATARAALQVCKLPLLGAHWAIDPAKNTDGDVETQDQFIADFLDNQLFKGDIKFKRFLKEAMTCLEFGHSVFEKVYAPVTFEGKTLIGLNKLASRKQITIWRWQMENGQPGIHQMVNGGTYDIPREKLVVFTYDKEGENDEGTSILRPVFKAWDIKDKLELIMAMSDERHAMGIVTATAKPGVTPAPADIEKAEDALSNIRANETLHMIIPNTFDIAMMDMKSSSLTNVLEHINYLDGRIMTGVLARFMELGGSSGSGAKSLSSDLSAFFMKAEEALAEEIAEYINDQIIKPLCDLNFSEFPNGYPKIVVSDIADDDLAVRTSAIAAMITAQAITADADIEESVREMLDLPNMSEETRDAYDHKNDELVATPDEKAATVTVAKKALKDTKDVKASLKAARAYRDGLISELVQG